MCKYRVWVESEMEEILTVIIKVVGLWIIFTSHFQLIIPSQFSVIRMHNFYKNEFYFNN